MTPETLRIRIRTRLAGLIMAGTTCNVVKYDLWSYLTKFLVAFSPWCQHCHSIHSKYIQWHRSNMGTELSMARNLIMLLGNLNNKFCAPTEYLMKIKNKCIKILNSYF